jgi:hypothetical protein
VYKCNIEVGNILFDDDYVEGGEMGFDEGVEGEAVFEDEMRRRGGAGLLGEVLEGADVFEELCSREEGLVVEVEVVWSEELHDVAGLAATRWTIEHHFLMSSQLHRNVQALF